jgi:hypothetical protein
VPFMELLRAQPNKLILGVDTRWIEGLVFNAYGVFIISYVTGPRQEIVLLEDLEDGQGHGASHRVAVVSDRRGLP